MSKKNSRNLTTCKLILKNNIDTFNYFPSSNRYDFPHIRFFTLSSMKKLLNISGFEINNNLSYFFVQPPLLHCIMPIWLKKFAANISTDNFSEGVLILAKKK